MAPGQDKRVSSHAVLVSVQATDASPFTVDIDGRPAKDLGDARFTGEVALLGDGPHEIGIVARDEAGNEARASVRVVRDTEAPRVVLDRPPAEVAEPSVTLTGRVDEIDAEVALEIDGEAVPLSGRRFSYARRLFEGSNRIRIVARDRAGNESERVEMVAYRKPAPPPPPPADPLEEATKAIARAEEEGDYAKAADLLRKLIARGGLPRDREVQAVGRLATTLDRRLGEWREALPWYRRYRALGGEDRRLLQRLRELEDRY